MSSGRGEMASGRGEISSGRDHGMRLAASSGCGNHLGNLPYPGKIEVLGF
jgi:hypothetical protein